MCMRESTSEGCERTHVGGGGRYEHVGFMVSVLACVYWRIRVLLRIHIYISFKSTRTRGER